MNLKYLIDINYTYMKIQLHNMTSHFKHENETKQFSYNLTFLF